MPEEVREFQVTVLVASVTGFLLGGLVGARYAGDKFVTINQSAKFSSLMQAQVFIQCSTFYQDWCIDFCMYCIHVHVYLVPK